MTSLSFSSRMMSSLSSYRNEGFLGRRAIAQVGYGLIVVVNLIEGLIARFFTVFAVIGVLLSGGEDRHCQTLERMGRWLQSADRSFIWSLGSFFLNPFVRRIVVNEQEVEEMIMSRVYCNC